MSEQELKVSLTVDELSLLRIMMDERIIAATEAGIPENDASSVFRENLFNKLHEAENESFRKIQEAITEKVRDEA